MTCVVKQPWALYKLHFYCTFSHRHALLAVCVCMCGYSHEMERTQNMNAGVFTSDVCDDISKHLLLRSSAEQVHTEILCVPAAVMMMTGLSQTHTWRSFRNWNYSHRSSLTEQRASHFGDVYHLLALLHITLCSLQIWSCLTDARQCYYIYIVNIVV